MAYFPHAFQKMLVGTTAEPATAVPFYDGDGTTGIDGTTTTLSLAAGQIGIVSAKNHVCADLDATPTYVNYPMFYFAQGSFHTSDSLGGSMHGGMQETVKSKYINPKYISKFYKTIPAIPINQVVQVSADGCELDCNKTYWLKVDIKGSPALRFLARNSYLTVDGFTGCCNDNEDPVDPNVVMLQWADQINAHPTLSPFVQATVWNDVTAQAPITGSVSGANATVSSATGLAAGQRVIFTPSSGSVATAWNITGNILTLTTVAANDLFSVGQEIQSVASILTAGTKIVSRISGDGHSGSVFTVNNPHNTGAITSDNLSSTDPVTCYVKSTYTTGVTVPLIMANTIQTASADVDIHATTSSAVDMLFYGAIATATYTALTTGVDDVSSFLELVGAYVGTSFGDCSFSPKDHYEIEPVKIYASIVDESGDPCEVYCFSVAEVTTAYQGKGYGEPLIRELILAKSYQQVDWYCDPRMIEVTDNTVFDELSRTGKYYVYHILHSVPRKSNPDGTMDNDQYLVKLVIGEGNGSSTGYFHGNVAKFETWMAALLASANNHVRLEVVY